MGVFAVRRVVSMTTPVWSILTFARFHGNAATGRYADDENSEDRDDSTDDGSLVAQNIVDFVL